MKIVVKNSNYKYGIMSYIYVFLLIYFSSGFSLSVLSGTKRMLLFFGLSVVILIDACLNRQTLKLTFPALAALGLTMVSYILNGDSIETIILGVAYFLVAIVFCSHIDASEWTEIYVKVIYFLSIASLILYAFAMLFPSYFSKLPTVTNSQGYVSRTIFFAVSSGSARNTGIVWEPGAYQAYLIIALLIEWFANRLSNFKRSAVIMLALITTFSTAGFISLCVLILCGIVDSLVNKLEKKKSTIFIVVVLLMIMLAYFYMVYYQPVLFYKLFGKVSAFSESGNMQSSAGTRYSAIKGGIEAFIRHPIIGLGYSNYKAYVMANYQNSMPTCTVVNWFGMFGIFFGVLMICSLGSFTKYLTKNKLIRFLILTLLLITTSSEDFTLNPSILIIVFYGMQCMGQSSEEMMLPDNSIA